MTNDNKKMVYNLLDICTQKVDPGLTFPNQIQFISNMMENLLKLTETDVNIDDPELKEMIKSSVVVIEDKPIIFAKGFTPWLYNLKPNIDWKFYNRYENYLFKAKRWNWGSIQSINESTDIILDHLQNPQTDSFFGIKGLVMGDIQSGKTANYTALINKALDVGYKFIIVLAGLTKDLRSQTQKRLDREVLGYETRTDFKKGNPIGVGINSKDDLYINAITHSGDSGDLKKNTADAITTVLNNGMQPLIAVLKKNSSVLNALLTTILSSEVGAKTNSKFNVPVLLIDDEVDQASVNTKDSKHIEESSTINRLIRKMLLKFNRYAYVGYTATPFANVFINPYELEGEEKDIFPEDFIICLTRPQNYCGVREYFGIEFIDTNDSDDDALTMDLYCKIDDYYSLFNISGQKTIIKVDTSVVQINKSMEDAFMHFIIASAIKYSRGITEHNSMLIHIARFKSPSNSLKDLVHNKISNMLKAYKYGAEEDREKYKEFWENKIVPISQDRLMSDYTDEWDNISSHIISVFEMTLNGIKVINGDSGDVCDYESSNVGQHIIIGGDKLSRGLTLEGLIVSYYNRNSKAYDTLLQMGRWFGYRNGWIDLCRIYTTTELVNNFIDAEIAIEMFRNDIAEMNALKLTPAQFGLKIKYSPKLAPTASSKMRLAQKQKISFSESLQQLLSYKKDYVQFNRSLTEKFLKGLPNPNQRVNGNIVFNNVKASKILEYLRQYKECDELVGSVSIKNWINYISNLNVTGELINWTVVLHSNHISNEIYADELAGFKIRKSQYTDRNLYADNSMDNLYLKAVTSPSDFRDFYLPNTKEYKEINGFKAGDPSISRTFTKEHGLIAIYSIDVYKKIFDKEIVLSSGKKQKRYTKGTMLAGGCGIIGLGVWFPKTENYESSAVEYYVNPIYRKNLDDEEDDSI